MTNCIDIREGSSDQHPAVYGVARNRQLGVGGTISRRLRAYWKIDAANAPVSAPDRFSSRIPSTL
jgi:hypothetical protein